MARCARDTHTHAGNDKHIHVWSLTSFAQLARLEGHAEAITCLALDGNFLLSGSEDGVVHVWDMHSYVGETPARAPHAWAHACAWCACASSRVWHVRAMRARRYMALASLKLHELSIEGMLVVPENGLLVTCSTDSTVRVWDYGMGREVAGRAASPERAHSSRRARGAVRVHR